MKINIIAQEDEKALTASKPLLLTWHPTYCRISIYYWHDKFEYPFGSYTNESETKKIAIKEIQCSNALHVTSTKKWAQT